MFQLTSKPIQRKCTEEHVGSCRVTFHPTQVNTPRLNPSQTGRYSIFSYPGGIEGWVDLDDCLHTEIVYPPTDGHPSKY